MQPEEPTASLPSSHYWALLHMYHSMTALELKKEKIKIIQDLEQLNTIVTELVMGENEALCAIEDLDREVSRQNKLRLTLEKSLDSFSYMLTGDYNVQLEEELARSKKKLKMLKQEVSVLTRKLSMPMVKVEESCSGLEKQVFQLQMEIEEGKMKNRARQAKLKSVVLDNNNKATLILELNKRIGSHEPGYDEQRESKPLTNAEDLQRYEMLVKKRERCKKLTQGTSKQLASQYKELAKKLQQLEEFKTELQNCLNSIEQTIQARQAELNTLKASKVSSLRRVRMKSSGSEQLPFARKARLSTDTGLETTFLIQRERDASRVREQGLQRQSVRIGRLESQEELILPKIYEILGKNRSLVGEEEDLRGLIYY